MNEKGDAMRLGGSAPKPLGFIALWTKAMWHLIRQWNANLFPLAYRL